MSKILFTPKQIEQLQKNLNVQHVSERTITYTDVFKSQVIDGFDEEIIGIKRIEQAVFRMYIKKSLQLK